MNDNVGVLAVNSANQLYNNVLTQFMNLQIAYGEKKLNREQATKMLKNLTSMITTGYKSINRVAGKDSVWSIEVSSDYKEQFKELLDQMSDFLYNELNPAKAL